MASGVWHNGEGTKMPTRPLYIERVAVSRLMNEAPNATVLADHGIFHSFYCETVVDVGSKSGGKLADLGASHEKCNNCDEFFREQCWTPSVHTHEREIR